MTMPIRTCVGCGGRAPQASLRRFVFDGERLLLDDRWRAPGRGAYLHPEPVCWEGLVRRRGPVRSLRATPTRVAREALTATLSSRMGA